MTILLTILMFALFLWCKSTGEKNGSGIFLVLTIGGIFTIIMESLPKSWTETTPTTMLITLIVVVVIVLSAIVSNKVKK